MGNSSSNTKIGSAYMRQPTCGVRSKSAHGLQASDCEEFGFINSFGRGDASGQMPLVVDEISEGNSSIVTTSESPKPSRKTILEEASSPPPMVSVSCPAKVMFDVVEQASLPKTAAFSSETPAVVGNPTQAQGGVAIATDLDPAAGLGTVASDEGAGDHPLSDDRAMYFCPHCGTRHLHTDNFCSKCGKKTHHKIVAELNKNIDELQEWLASLTDGIRCREEQINAIKNMVKICAGKNLTGIKDPSSGLGASHPRDVRFNLGIICTVSDRKTNETKKVLDVSNAVITPYKKGFQITIGSQCLKVSKITDGPSVENITRELETAQATLKANTNQ